MYGGVEGGFSNGAPYPMFGVNLMFWEKK